MNKNKFFPVALFVLLGVSNAFAGGISVDGLRDLDYTLDATQTIQTGYGDNSNELNAAYSHISMGRLYVLVTGNLEQNFNKLEIFLDTESGVGENFLSGTPEYDFGFESQNLAGMQFDSAFTANYHLYARGGFDGSSDLFDFDIVDRAGGTSAMVNSNGGRVFYDVGMQTASGVINPGDFGLFGNSAGNVIGSPVLFGFNNSNIGGIGGNTGAMADPLAAEAVMTGFEFSVALSDLGIDQSTATEIRVAMMINNNNHASLSNQVLGGLPVGFGNLFSPSSVNFDGFSGDQFYTISVPAIPEPSSAILLSLAGTGCLIRRRR